MLHTVLYVSRKTTPWPQDAEVVADIVAVAQARNAEHAVTGALASTDAYFAQVLEGSEDALRAIMASILRDRRHFDVRIITDQATRGRFHPNWALAYSGPATFVSRLIAPLLEGPPAAYETRRLTLLLREFNRPATGT